MAGSAAVYDALVLADSPYLYWKMDAPSYNGAPDSSGNGRDALQLVGNAPTVILNGPFPSTSAYVFSGTRLNRSPGNDWGNPPVTYECLIWRDPADSPTSRAISSERDDFGGGWSLAFGASGDIQNQSFGSGVSAGVVIGDSAWHHIVWVYDGGTGTWKCYKDRQKIYDNAGFGSGRRSFLFGVGAWGNPSISNVGNPFTGRINRVAVYTSALSETRIQAHADEFLRPSPPSGQVPLRSSGNLGFG